MSVNFLAGYFALPSPVRNGARDFGIADDFSDFDATVGQARETTVPFQKIQR